MIRLFGFADMVAGLLFVASFYQLDIPREMVVVIGVYLIFKGIAFLRNYFSLIDLGAGILLVFVLTSAVPPFVLIGLAVFLGIKGLITVFS